VLISEQWSLDLLGNSHQHPLDRRLGWCGIFDEQEKLCPCSELNHSSSVVGPIPHIRYWMGEYFRQFTIFNFAILSVRSINYPQVSKRIEGGRLGDKTTGGMTMESWFDSRPALGLTQASIQWAQRDCEIGQSSTSNANIKEQSSTSATSYTSIHYTGTFTFTRNITRICRRINKFHCFFLIVQVTHWKRCMTRRPRITGKTVGGRRRNLFILVYQGLSARRDSGVTLTWQLR